MPFITNLLIICCLSSMQWKPSCTNLHPLILRGLHCAQPDPHLTLSFNSSFFCVTPHSNYLHCHYLRITILLLPLLCHNFKYFISLWAIFLYALKFCFWHVWQNFSLCEYWKLTAVFWLISEKLIFVHQCYFLLGFLQNGSCPSLSWIS